MIFFVAAPKEFFEHFSWFHFLVRRRRYAITSTTWMIFSCCALSPYIPVSTVHRVLLESFMAILEKEKSIIPWDMCVILAAKLYQTTKHVTKYSIICIHLIVNFSSIFIWKDVICFWYLLKSMFCFSFIIWILVRMILNCKFTIYLSSDIELSSDHICRPRKR